MLSSKVGFSAERTEVVEKQRTLTRYRKLKTQKCTVFDLKLKISCGSFVSINVNKCRNKELSRVEKSQK